MNRTPLALAALLLLSTSGPALAGDTAPRTEGPAAGGFVVKRHYIEPDQGLTTSSISGLVRSLERARRNGVDGSSRALRVFSLDQALQERDWRHSVSRRLGAAFDGAATRQRVQSAQDGARITF